MFPSWDQIVQAGQIVYQGYQAVVDFILPDSQSTQNKQALPPSQSPNSQQSHYSQSVTSALGNAVRDVVHGLSPLGHLPIWDESLLFLPPSNSPQVDTWSEIAIAAVVVACFGPLAIPVSVLTNPAVFSGIRQYLASDEAGQAARQGAPAGQAAGHPTMRVFHRVSLRNLSLSSQMPPQEEAMVCR